MPSTIMSVSLPTALTEAVDTLAARTHQNRSELVRSALREYIVDAEGERERFVKAYKATRKESSLSLKKLKTKYAL